MPEFRGLMARRFPPRWSVEEQEAYFVVREHDGQQLAYVYYQSEPGRRSAAKLLSQDEVRRIAANIAKLLELIAYGLISGVWPHRKAASHRPPESAGSLTLFCVEGLLKNGTANQVVALGDPFVSVSDPQHQNLCIGIEHPFRQSASLFGAFTLELGVFYRGLVHHGTATSRASLLAIQ